MRKTPLLFVAGAIGACTLVASTDAHALGPLSLEVGINAGYGSNPDSNSYSPNPLGFGLGGRAGVSVFGLYGGLAGDYYFGSSENGLSAHTAKYGLQVGYNLGIPFITIRPQVGFGNLSISYSGSSSGVGAMSGVSPESQNSLWIEPGVVGLITLGIFFVGADINALMVTKYPETLNPDGSWGTSFKVALTAHGQLGLTF